MSLLTTGVNSGLGKHLYKKLGGDFITRDTDVEKYSRLKHNGVDQIIHCAVNSSRNVHSNNVYDYVSDNVLLTKRLTSIPHSKFIFISSVDVYPKNRNIHDEDEIINTDDIKGIYGMTKLISESIVEKHCTNYAILRCSSLLGQYSRKNNTLKILDADPCELSVTADSLFNYVLHTDVESLISYILKTDIQGIFNVAAARNIAISDVAKLSNKSVKYGTFHYDVGLINNSKITNICKSFEKTSEQTILQFQGERLNGR